MYIENSDVAEVANFVSRISHAHCEQGKLSLRKFDSKRRVAEIRVGQPQRRPNLRSISLIGIRMDVGLP